MSDEVIYSIQVPKYVKPKSKLSFWVVFLIIFVIVTFLAYFIIASINPVWAQEHQNDKATGKLSVGMTIVASIFIGLVIAFFISIWFI